MKITNFYCVVLIFEGPAKYDYTIKLNTMHTEIFRVTPFDIILSAYAFLEVYHFRATI